MKKKNTFKNNLKYAIVGIAKKASSMEANTTCAYLGYQSEEPDAVKKLRKF